MKNKLLIALILCFVISACSNNESLHSQQAVLKIDRTLKLGDTLTLKIPDTINNFSNITSPYFNFFDNYFHYSDQVKDNTIKVYNYDLKQHVWETLSLNTQGPNQVFGIGGFSVRRDSILYFPLNDSRLVILNGNGDKLNEFIYSKNRMIAYNSQVKTPSTYIDSENNVYFDITEYKRLDQKSTFTESYLVGKLNLETGDFSKIINYPSEFTGITWSTNDVGRNHVVVNDFIYFNFSKSKFIYKYDLGGSLISKRLISTKKIKDSEGFPNNDPYQNALTQLKNGHYVAIVYNKWNKTFYRIATYLDTDINFSLDNPESIGQAFKFQKVEIIAFNQDLEIIAKNEFLTRNSGISDRSYFVNQDGLYLYQNNTNRREGEMYFRRIDQEIISH